MNRANGNGHLGCVAVSMRAELACFRRVALVARSERAGQGSHIYNRVTRVQSTGCAIRNAGCTWHVCYSFHFQHRHILILQIGGPCIAGMVRRSGIRHRYHIDGNRFADCLSHAFCMPCALTQESREIALEESNLAVPRMKMGEWDWVGVCICPCCYNCPQGMPAR